MTEREAPALAHRPLRTATRLVLALMVAALLAGCGKKGNPTPPTDEPNTFPRAYPRA